MSSVDGARRASLAWRRWSRCRRRSGRSGNHGHRSHGRRARVGIDGERCDQRKRRGDFLARGARHIAHERLAVGAGDHQRPADPRLLEAQEHAEQPGAFLVRGSARAARPRLDLRKELRRVRARRRHRHPDGLGPVGSLRWCAQGCGKGYGCDAPRDHGWTHITAAGVRARVARTDASVALAALDSCSPIQRSNSPCAPSWAQGAGGSRRQVLERRDARRAFAVHVAQRARARDHDRR